MKKCGCNSPHFTLQITTCFRSNTIIDKLESYRIFLLRLRRLMSCQQKWCPHMANLTYPVAFCCCGQSEAGRKCLFLLVEKTSEILLHHKIVIAQVILEYPQLRVFINLFLANAVIDFSNLKVDKLSSEDAPLIMDYSNFT